MASTVFVTRTLDGFGANAEIKIVTDEGITITYRPAQRREGGFADLENECKRQPHLIEEDLKEGKFAILYATSYYATCYTFPANEMGEDLLDDLNKGVYGAPRISMKGNNLSPKSNRDQFTLYS